jgi:hypothetical protein
MAKQQAERNGEGWRDGDGRRERDGEICEEVCECISITGQGCRAGHGSAGHNSIVHYSIVII